MRFMEWAKLQGDCPKPSDLVMYLGRSEWDEINNVTKPLINVTETKKGHVLTYMGIPIVEVLERSYFKIHKVNPYV